MKKAVISGIIIVFIIIITAGLLWLFLPSRLPEKVDVGDIDQKYAINYDVSSIDALYHNPEMILEDAPRFWATDSAYQLVSLAPHYRTTELPPDGWISDIEKLSTMSIEKREREKGYARSEEILEHADTFYEYGLPVILSLLPEEADLSTTVYLTDFNEPAWFAFESNVVINIGDPSPFIQTTNIFNIIAHELFHIGYFDLQPFQTDTWSDYYPANVILSTLHNDGMAVYTQYLLSSVYSNRTDIELMFLRFKPAVNIMVNRVNELISEIETLSEEELMQQVYFGSNRRALYVAGAYMARTIDERLGRESLIETVRQGSSSFISTYNAIADEGMEIVEIPEPEKLSPIQKLRQSALAGDYETIPVRLREVEKSMTDEPGGAVFEQLRSTGLILKEDNQSALAVEVFNLMTILFPDHSNVYMYLGNAYAQNGDDSSAQAAYTKAIEIEPRLEPVIYR
ncbi:MAG: hypothetical protein JSU58_11535 [Dehalococcoidales bacterium]|nr:MAG: hypothetical protein JSU58_11535 [Dehalococcoidales bacterium]